MEKSHNIILAQAFMLLCAFALPFISVYCQESRQKPAPKRTLVRRKVRRARPTAKIPATKPIEQPIQTIEKAESPETAEEAENAAEETETTTTAGTKQAQAATQAPDTWSSSIYKTLAIVLLNSLYKGSETGIGALTKIVIKRFTERRDVLAVRAELESEKKELESKVNYLKTLPEEELIVHQKILKNISKESADIITKLEKLEKLEKQTSLPAIAATGVYMGILNTAVPMMGVVMGTAVKLALQMLMPAEQ